MANAWFSRASAGICSTLISYKGSQNRANFSAISATINELLIGSGTGWPMLRFRRGGKYRVGAAMFDRLGEYLSRAVALRLLAKRTAYPEVQDQLLELAAAFERLAEYTEKREQAVLPTPSD